MKNKKFDIDILSVPNVFKKLSIVESDGEKFLGGEIDIIDGNGRLWDTYKIEIKGSDKYPMEFPLLYETGNAFPKIADWHVNDTDKSCCVDVAPNELIVCKNGLNIIDYINNFVIPYLANQTFRKREGYYLYGEYSHGISGKIEYYQNKLKAKTPLDLVKMIDFIIKGINLPRTAYCPFCRNIKFRHCHRDVFRELQNIKGFLAIDIMQIISFLDSNPNYK